MGYSNAELRQILRAAGWPEALIPIMAAIGQSESSGDPTSYRNCPGNGYCTITQGGRTYTTREVPGQGPERSAGFFKSGMLVSAQNRVMIATAIVVVILAFVWREFK